MQEAFGSDQKMQAHAATLALPNRSLQQQQQQEQHQQPNAFLPQVVEPGAPIITGRAATAAMSRQVAAHPHSPGRPAANILAVQLDAQAAAEQARQRIQKAKKRKSKAQRQPVGVGFGADDTSSSLDADLLSQNQNSSSSWNDSSGAKGTADGSSGFLRRNEKMTPPGKMKSKAPPMQHGAVAYGATNEPDWTRDKDPRMRIAAVAAAADRSVPQYVDQQQQRHSYTDTSEALSTDTNRRGSYDDIAAAKDPERRISAAFHRLQGPGSVAVTTAMKHGEGQQHAQRIVKNGEPYEVQKENRPLVDTSILAANKTENENRSITVEDLGASPPAGAVVIDISRLESGGRVNVEGPDEGDEIMEAPVVLAAAVRPAIEIETMDTVPDTSDGLVWARPVTDADDGGVDQDAEREHIEALERQKRELEERMEEERRAAIPAQPVTGEETNADLEGSKQAEEVEKLENKPRFSRRFLYGMLMVAIVIIAVVIGVVVSSSSPSTSTATTPTLSPSILLPPITSPPTVMPTMSMAPTPKVFEKFQTNAELITAVNSYWETSGTNATLAAMYGHPIGTWDVSQITDFSNVFSADRNTKMSTFTADLSLWNVGNGEVFTNMFKGATVFQSDLSRWDTSKATDMGGMFNMAANFTSDLSRWQTGRVTSMSLMFVGATRFNSDLSRWDTSSVSLMAATFWMASSFSSNISAWNVGNVENMDNMFAAATNFTSDLSGWKPVRVRTMKEIFSGATKFSSNLCSWGSDLVSVAVTDMFTNTACPNTTDPNLTTKTPFCYNCNGN